MFTEKIDLGRALYGYAIMPQDRTQDYGETEFEEPEEEVDGRLAFTSSFGSRPVNAITGAPYQFKLGSSEQLSLFEVRSTTGELDLIGTAVKAGQERPREPVRMFYDSPKQYLVHRAALLGMGTSDDDVEHMMRYGYGSQPPMDLAAWADMTVLWKSRQTTKSS